MHLASEETKYLDENFNLNIIINSLPVLHLNRLIETFMTKV